MTQLDKDAVVAAFKEAYLNTHGKQADLVIKSGWYKVDGGKGMRLAQLHELVLTMTAEAQIASTDEEVETAAIESTVEEPVKDDVTLAPVEDIKVVTEEPPKSVVEEAPVVDITEEPETQPVAKKRFSIKAMWQDIVSKVKG